MEDNSVDTNKPQPEEILVEETVIHLADNKEKVETIIEKKDEELAPFVAKMRYPTYEQKEKWKPSLTQLAVIEGITVEGLSILAACRKAGIGKSSFYKWMDQSNFSNLLKRTRDKVIATSLAGIDRNISKIAESPKSNQSVAAARLIYQRAGELDEETNKPAITIQFNAFSEGKIARPPDTIIDAEIVEDTEKHDIIPSVKINRPAAK